MANLQNFKIKRVMTMFYLSLILYSMIVSFSISVKSLRNKHKNRFSSKRNRLATKEEELKKSIEKSLKAVNTFIISKKPTNNLLIVSEGSKINLLYDLNTNAFELFKILGQVEKDNNNKTLLNSLKSSSVLFAQRISSLGQFLEIINNNESDNNKQNFINAQNYLLSIFESLLNYIHSTSYLEKVSNYIYDDLKLVLNNPSIFVQRLKEQSRIVKEFNLKNKNLLFNSMTLE